MRGLILAMALLIAATAHADNWDGPSKGDWSEADFSQKLCGRDLKCHALSYKLYRSNVVYAALHAACGETKPGSDNEAASNCWARGIKAMDDYENR
jgi:hypothetical protein